MDDRDEVGTDRVGPTLQSRYDSALASRAIDVPRDPDPGTRNADLVLEVNHLTVTLGRSPILSDVSFAVGRGDTLAIIGPNGSGKTVLLRALIGALPHEGTIRWAQGTRVGYVPQKLDIERDLPVSGRDLLRAKAAVDHAAPEEIPRALQRVDLSRDVLPRTIGSMSGGQFQRLLVACALIGSPTVLLLDEPAAGIDAPGQEVLNTALRRLRVEDNVTTLLVSHDLSVVHHSASLVLCLARHHAWVGAPEIALAPERLSELYGEPIRLHLHDDGH